MKIPTLERSRVGNLNKGETPMSRYHQGKFYAGIGSRKTPLDVLEDMKIFSKILYGRGYTLRSGGAKGADTAFESEAKDRKEIFYADDATWVEEQIASIYHPAWESLPSYAKKLHGRNALQVLGKGRVSHVRFVLCWTPDGCEHHKQRTHATGGTGTAISIASDVGIPVFNIKKRPMFEILAAVNELESEY